MSIKNALKILFNRFEIVGEILLFLLILTIAVCGLGAIYVQPIIRAAIDLDFNKYLLDFVNSIFSQSSLDVIIDKGKEILVLVKHIFIGKEGVIFSTFIAPVLFFVTFNLLSNMYELPLCKVLEARMSSNAKISLMGNVISLSGKSALYVLVKLLFTIICDSIICLAMWGAYELTVAIDAPLLIPFAEVFVVLILVSFRKCFTVNWSQNIIIGEKKIFPSFFASVKSGFGHFWYTFSSYFVCCLMAFVLNSLMALLTFGVGLIISIPMTMLFFKTLEMTAYYKWNKKRYYLDGHTIIDEQEVLTDKLD